MPYFISPPTILEPSQRHFETQEMTRINTFALVSSTLYCSYIGKLNAKTAFAFIKFWVSTAGAGAQTAEIGLLTSPAAPNATGQTLTCRVATGSMTSLTSTGLKVNSSTFSGTAIETGSHVWVGIRTAMATTQPTISGALGGDLNAGILLWRTSSAALSVSTTYVMTVPTAAISTTAICPRLVVTLD